MKRAIIYLVHQARRCADYLRSNTETPNRSIQHNESRIDWPSAIKFGRMLANGERVLREAEQK